jgi:hypothetical protein
MKFKSGYKGERLGDSGFPMTEDRRLTTTSYFSYFTGWGPCSRVCRSQTVPSRV